jgi:hypothetical protein
VLELELPELGELDVLPPALPLTLAPLLEPELPFSVEEAAPLVLPFSVEPAPLRLDG